MCRSSAQILITYTIIVSRSVGKMFFLFRGILVDLFCRQTAFNFSQAPGNPHNFPAVHSIGPSSRSLMCGHTRCSGMVCCLTSHWLYPPPGRAFESTPLLPGGALPLHSSPSLYGCLNRSGSARGPRDFSHIPPSHTGRSDSSSDHPGTFPPQF